MVCGSKGLSHLLGGCQPRKELPSTSGHAWDPTAYVASSSLLSQDNSWGTRDHAPPAWLSRERAKRGMPSLSLDFAITRLVSSVKAATPRTVVQTEGVEISQVRQIAKAYDRHEDWWLHQTATIICIGFLCIFRLGELCRLKEQSVRVVFTDGSELRAHRIVFPVDCTNVKAVLLHVPWRKSHQAKDCLVVLACQKTVGCYYTSCFSGGEAVRGRCFRRPTLRFFRPDHEKWFDVSANLTARTLWGVHSSLLLCS